MGWLLFLIASALIVAGRSHGLTLLLIANFLMIVGALLFRSVFFFTPGLANILPATSSTPVFINLAVGLAIAELLDGSQAPLYDFSEPPVYFYCNCICKGAARRSS